MFGGEARLHCQTRQAGGASGKTETFNFRVGGKNPSDAVAKAFIQANDTDPDGFEHWYAYAIAKHESKWKNVNRVKQPNNPGNIYGDPADPLLGRYYNQFWEGKAGPPNDYQGAGFPVHNDDKKNAGRDPQGTGGFGVFQITRSKTEGAKFHIPRSSIWNWQANTIEAVSGKLREKRAQSDSLVLIPQLPQTGYVRHAVPRVRAPGQTGDPMNAEGNTAIDPVTKNTIPGWLFGGDVPDSTVVPNPPNAFGPFTVGLPDYRTASFASRPGYLILDTIRRYNGGRYVVYRDSGWEFCRWRGDGVQAVNGVVQPNPYERQSYVDLIAIEFEPGDVPPLFLP